MMGMDPILRILFVVGALLYLFIILYLLKKGKLNVQYSIIWLISAVVILLFTVFPGIISFLRYTFKIETGANFVFILGFVFVFLLLLSLSIVITGFANKIKLLSQKQALLEKRIRELESELAKKQNL